MIYLDHAATTPLDPRVLDAMLPHLREGYGNASSVHALGRRARFAVEESRERVAARLGAAPGEIVFTSGGTEADNTALRGVAGGVVTGLAEHEAVLRPAESLRAAGREVIFLPPGPLGAVTADMVEAALTPATRLVSIMHANNETGAVSPIREIAARCRARGVLVHTDAVQTAGLLPLSVDELGVDLLSLSAHKFYGPKGAGVLYVRAGTELRPLVEGGSQERRRRGGTEAVASIAGLARALDLAAEEAAPRAAHAAALRDRLYRLLREALGDAFLLNTPLEPEGAAVPHILNVAFPPDGGRALDGEMLLLNLDVAGICVSSGSACTSGTLEPSHVLLAMGRDRATAAAAVRFSFGRDNTPEEIESAAAKLVEIIGRMRGRGGQGREE